MKLLWWTSLMVCLVCADAGLHAAFGSDAGFMKGLNVAAGKLTYEPVARDQGLEYTSPQDALAAVPAAA